MVYGIYPRFFYLNNGELNWDAISTISNICLVSLLVIVTIWYSSEVKKQTNLMKKENERIIVLEWIKNFLYPCLNNMKNYIQYINDNQYYWNQSNGKSQISYIWKITDPKDEISFAKADVFKKHPDLEVLCSEYDKLHDGIIQVYDEIIRTIENTAKIDCLKELLQNFIQETNINLDEATIDPVNYFLQQFVNYKYYKKYGSNDDIKTRFLNFDDKIIDCIKTTEYDELDKVKDEKIDQFKEQINEIEEKIKEIIGSYRQEYHISENEMKMF